MFFLALSLKNSKLDFGKGLPMNLFRPVSIHKSNQDKKKDTFSFQFVIHSTQFLAVPVLSILPPGGLILELFNFNYKF